MVLHAGHHWPTNFSEARMMQVNAARADFSAAVMDDSDLTQANLQGAACARPALSKRG